MNRNYLTAHFLSPKTAGAFLILLAGLALAGMAWHQEKQLARASERIGQVHLRSAEKQRLLPSGENPSILLKPVTVVPLAFLLAFAGSTLLVRAPASTSTKKSPNESQKIPSPAEAKSTAEILGRQRDLAQAEKTAVTAEFAASISHEIRNPIAGIQMSLANLISETTDHELRERLATLSSEAVRVTDILTQAVALARNEPEPSQSIDLAPWTERFFELLRFQIPDNLQLEHDIEPGIHCHLPPNRLGCCLSNIVTNSIQAIGDNPGWVRLQVETRAEYVALVVLDSGPGFSENILRGGSLPSGSGTQARNGLGLAMTRRFVREMSGRIELSNAPSGSSTSGALVTILLPSASHNG
jgi:signal transduction histidine kinase|tara:strand:- start:516 stop:1583 length:1068 start_codon:yes stop_codon:yes gene_type:complete